MYAVTSYSSIRLATNGKRDDGCEVGRSYLLRWQYGILGLRLAHYSWHFYGVGLQGVGFPSEHRRLVSGVMGRGYR